MLALGVLLLFDLGSIVVSILLFLRLPLFFRGQLADPPFECLGQ